jgi:hypothetical protein
MAKKWIVYDHGTTLAPAQQKIYDEAYALSEEKPSCCKCWHYFVNEGIAKQMIKKRHVQRTRDCRLLGRFGYLRRLACTLRRLHIPRTYMPLAAGPKRSQ